MLVDNPEILEEIFSKVKCQFAFTVKTKPPLEKTQKSIKEKYGEDIPCKISSSYQK